MQELKKLIEKERKTHCPKRWLNPTNLLIKSANERSSYTRDTSHNKAFGHSNNDSKGYLWGIGLIPLS